MPAVYLPGSANSSSPTTALPVIEGGVVFCGAAAADTTLLGFELTGPVFPSAFEAVTSDIRVWPTSVLVNVYLLNVAAMIVAQFPPFTSQRSH